MEAERCNFFIPLRSCTFRQSPIVTDCRRSSPIRDRKIRAMKKRFVNALWSTCAKCAYKSWPLNFHWTTILNSRKTVPLDGKQCDIVLVIILCDRASMFTVCHPNLVTLIELLYTGRPSLVPRPFRGGKKGLVSTDCACVKLYQKNMVIEILP